ncbi:P-type conjugative transfer protein TrbL [Geobacter grbiciae]|uniref:P-type conjugative transfer protein TrbL n=1 Tax=Geobacter grbiciae TaxID=155042 RepID=UPI001C027CE1|nr:P-type conjugative transfer protein TrbL [Geobacter grbiciae]MBT1077216.1 P-type conjugative transfer protein TrbL [Geobacter grbiciae]
MGTDSGILTTLLNTFSSAFTGGYGQIFGDAWSLLGILAALELTIAAVWWALTESDALKELLRLCIKVGFFIFVVTKYDWLIDKVISGFINTGLKAGGSGSISLIKDPSAIVDYGLTVTEPIFQHIQNYGAVDTLANLPDVIMTGLAGLLVLLAFFALAIQVFITYLEFYLIAVLSLILIPFGVFKYTSFITEKVFGAIISFGIRLMVLSFIVSVSRPVLAGLNLPPDPPLQKIMIMFLAVVAIAMLAWHAPGIAGGLLAGSPSLTAGAGMGVGAAAALGIAGGGLAAKQAMKETASGGVAATRAAAHGAGAVASAARMGAVAEPGGAVSQTVGAAKGVASMARNVATETVSTAAAGIRESYQTGAERGFTATGGTVVGRGGDPAGSGTPGSGGPSVKTGGGATTTAAGSGGASRATDTRSTTTPNAPNQKPDWANRLQQAKATIPPEATPTGGLSVPIPDNEKG